MAGRRAVKAGLWVAAFLVLVALFGVWKTSALAVAAVIEEIPGAISEGATIEEARENLADALRMVLECNREIARRSEPPQSHREPLELAAL